MSSATDTRPRIESCPGVTPGQIGATQATASPRNATPSKCTVSLRHLNLNPTGARTHDHRDSPRQ